ncbi:ATP-binding cassette domain-containing protein [Enterococcus olivae]
MISFQDVRVVYSMFELNCTMEIKEGMITGIIGENGAGKTTIFKMLLGIIPVQSGRILIDGVAVEQLSVEKKEKIGTVLSDAFFNGLYTVRNIDQLLKTFYPEHDSNYFLSKCRQLQLPEKQMIKEFSTGMLAKLKVLSALSHQADILILDEPTSGLDVSARYQIMGMLQDYLEENPKCSILISSHISSDLEKLCDEVYYLKQGKILLHEETDVLLDTYGVLKVEKETIGSLPEDFILYRKPTFYGYELLTNQRIFYQENYPQLVVEKPELDQILLMVMEGEKV